MTTTTTKLQTSLQYDHDEDNDEEKKEDNVAATLSSSMKSHDDCVNGNNYPNDFDDDVVTDEQVQAWLGLNTAKEDTTVPRQGPRANPLSWEEFFMATAVLSSLRSKEPNHDNDCRGGCCIVHPDTHKILAVGYTGFPKGASDDVLPWHTTAASNENDNNNNNNNNKWLWTREPYAVHACMNAILNKANNNIQGAHLYLTHFPCNSCTKVLIQAGVKEVIYKRQQPGNRVVTCSHSSHNAEQEEQVILSSRIMMKLAGVNVRTYRPQKGQNHHISISLHPPNNGSNGEMRREATRTTSGEEQIGSPDPVEPPKDDNNNTMDDPRYRYRELMKQEARGYDPVTQASGRRPPSQVLTWSEYFMAFSLLSAQRSKDPNTQVGACLVDSDTNRIVGLGYNGFPKGCSDHILPWTRSNELLQSKYTYVTHAEVNAILNRIAVPRHTTLYVALFPCNACAQVIVQANIQRVVYWQDKYHDEDTCRASRILFAMAGVEVVPFQPSPTTNPNITLTLA